MSSLKYLWLSRLNKIILINILILQIIQCQYNSFSGYQQPYNQYWTRSMVYQQPMFQQQPFQQQQQPFTWQQPANTFVTRQTSQLSSVTQSMQITNAVAKITGPNNVDGLVQFTFLGPNQVQVSGTISGLTAGKHGFHIHQLGDTRDGCKSMAGHFNPENNKHGAPNDFMRHVGDLGNIQANEQGVAEFNFIDQKISLNGPFSIIGRGVVVHAGEDDLGRGNHQDSLKTGNAGGRVGCGIVAIAAKPSSK